jgi:hypothetical protein
VQESCGRRYEKVAIDPTPTRLLMCTAAVYDPAARGPLTPRCTLSPLCLCRRRASLFANTFFMGVAYHPDDSQIVTVGTDRKVRGWPYVGVLCGEVKDGAGAVRMQAG